MVSGELHNLHCTGCHVDPPASMDTLEKTSNSLLPEIRPCSENGRRKITQKSIEVDAETKESTRKTEEKLDGRYKEGRE
jgi:hypothetical protein